MRITINTELEQVVAQFGITTDDDLVFSGIITGILVQPSPENPEHRIGSIKIMMDILELDNRVAAPGTNDPAVAAYFPQLSEEFAKTVLQQHGVYVENQELFIK